MTDEQLSGEELTRRKAAKEERKQSLRQESRLGQPFALRLPVATSLGIIVGAALGIGYGTKSAALRFRAENSHRLPTSATGWYLYHKSKNYCAALGGIKEGGKMGLKVGIWTGYFFATENVFDEWRGKKDFLNTVGASLAVAGGFSAWNSLPLPTSTRTARTALIVGLAYGLAQDALRYVKGGHLGYIDYILG